MAAGTSDGNIYIFDTRQTQWPIRILSGHSSNGKDDDDDDDDDDDGE